ncbi:hypothetical protein [Sphaerisporangium sp. TRM90804]|uniref:hypothetical protein n=1 Tax=Sphaerisporangium sp. TRM90804 TaxID=3031113 RepID=UPI0024487FDF|nr:hypothetical protein [Sphaerisporangium sp. TRM90804]MDH2429317.1 hypothetical protein [Sphaerisporangium sp. TRM90804]
MAFSLRAFFQLESELTSPLDLSTVSSPTGLSQQMNFAQGAGAGQADMVFGDRRTIAASATDSLDLAGGLTGPFGAALTFARIKMLVVRAVAGNTNNVNATRPASNGVPWLLAAGDGIAVQPGGMFVWHAPTAAGVVVTPSTGDLIDFVNSGAGTTVTYDVIIAGAAT